MDLNQLLGAFTNNANQRMGQVTATQQAFDADTQRIQSLLTVNEEEAAKVVQASAQTAAQEAAVNHKIGKAREANAALAGMNPDDLNNAYVRSIAEFDTAETQRAQLEQARSAEMRKVEQLAGTNLLDDPLGYLMAQLQLPTVAARHNSILNQENEAINRRAAAERNIIARTELIKAKDSIIAANTADTMLTINTSKAANAERAAQIELRQATADNISKIGARALDSSRLANEKFQIQSDLLNKTMSVEQWKLQREAAAQARAASAAAAADRLANAKDKDAEEAWMNEKLKAASFALGYTDPFTLGTIKFLPQAQKELLLKTALDGKFGGSLGESVSAVTSVGRPQAIAATNPGMSKFLAATTNGLRTYSDEVSRKAQASGQKLKAGEVLSEASDTYESEIVQSAQSFASKRNLNSPRWDANGVFNPYRTEYLALENAVDGGMLPQLQGNRALAIVKTLKKDLAPNASNIDGKSIERMVQVLAQQVGKGDVGIDAAATDLVKLHRVGAAKNLELYNYTQFGLPQQTSAIVTIPAVTQFSKPFQIDLMNPTSVKENLARMALESRMGSLGMAGKFFTDEATRRRELLESPYK